MGYESMAEFLSGTTAERAFAEHEHRELGAHIEREERFLIPLLETAVDEAATRGRSQ